MITVFSHAMVTYHYLHKKLMSGHTKFKTFNVFCIRQKTKSCNLYSRKLKKKMTNIQPNFSHKEGYRANLKFLVINVTLEFVCSLRILISVYLYSFIKSSKSYQRHWERCTNILSLNEFFFPWTSPSQMKESIEENLMTCSHKSFAFILHKEIQIVLNLHTNSSIIKQDGEIHMKRKKYHNHTPKVSFRGCSFDSLFCLCESS